MSSYDPSYPQAPPLTGEGLQDLLEQTHFARLGTINEDGSAHLSPLFFNYIDGQITMATQVRSRKVRNIKRNNNVSVLIDVTEPVFKGALVYGVAELDFEDVVSKRADILMRRSSKEQALKMAEGLCDRWESVIVRVTPTNIASFDYS